MMITEQDIRQLSGSDRTYARGMAYYSEGRVGKIRYNEDIKQFSASVEGSRDYEVRAIVSEEGDVRDYRCTCPDAARRMDACKHVVALLKAIAVQWPRFYGSTPSVAPQRNMVLTGGTRALLDFFGQRGREGTMNLFRRDPETRIVPTFHFSYIGVYKSCWLEFSIGNEQMYVLRQVERFAEALVFDEELSFGKKFCYNSRTTRFDPVSRQLADMIRETYEDEQSLAQGHYTGYRHSSAASAFSEERRLRLSASMMVKFFTMMKDTPFVSEINGQRCAQTIIREGRPDFRLKVDVCGNGLRVSPDLQSDVYYGLDSNFAYIFFQGQIYHTDPLFSRYLVPLMACFAENRRAEILIPQAETDAFVSSVLPEIEKIADIRLDPALGERFFRAELEKQVFLDRFQDGISARIQFRYGDITLNPAGGALEAMEEAQNNRLLLRNMPEENQLIQIFTDSGFQEGQQMYILSDEEAAYDFLLSALPVVRELAEVFYSEAFSNIRISRHSRVTTGVRLNRESDLLEMTFAAEGIDTRELMDLMTSYRLKKRYHRLRDGSFLSMEGTGLEMTARMIDGLGIKDSDLLQGMTELPKARALYIDALARESGSGGIHRSSSFKQMVQEITEPQDLEYEIPDGISGQLREYQKTGYRWLRTLADHGMGGILADDMGLGKTLQVITLLMSSRSATPRPSLVVAPTSLVYNWQSEINRFAPSLRVEVLSGAVSERRERFEEIARADVVVTSFGLIKRDIDQYQNMHFRFCIVDEAQHIKNPKTLNAKAVKQVRADCRFALTGTPVENTLTELWAMFDFVMPGYLFTHKRFVSRFETPVVKYEDPEALRDLGRFIRPFILRRMKEDVLRELPEKIESQMVCDMTPEQQKAYLAYLIKAKKEFEQELMNNGFEKSRIRILAILTRLRQICAHPGMFIENYHGGSGKLDMLTELLEDAVGSGHRVLVFSQFTSMLALVRQELDKRQMQYFYLDGETAAEERMARVRAFNGGERSVFLISLKAGGTGLNLTGADVVVHTDPWWNPAVEDQATGRAYRIGQKKTVQVFRLITRNTLEEKILKLQDKKKALIDSVIKPGEHFLSRMTETEIRQLFQPQEQVPDGAPQ